MLKGVVLAIAITIGTVIGSGALDKQETAEAAPTVECWYYVPARWHTHWTAFGGPKDHWHAPYWTYFHADYSCPPGYVQVG